MIKLKKFSGKSIYYVVKDDEKYSLSNPFYTEDEAKGWLDSHKGYDQIVGPKNPNDKVKLSYISMNESLDYETNDKINYNGDSIDITRGELAKLKSVQAVAGFMDSKGHKVSSHDVIIYDDGHNGWRFY